MSDAAEDLPTGAPVLEAEAPETTDLTTDDPTGPGADEALSPEAERRRRLAWLAVEIGFVVVVLAHVVAFALVVANQRRGDSLAMSTISLAEETGAVRILWPEELRGSVPVLLEAGLVPVLQPAGPIPVQQLSANDTKLVVTDDASGLDAVTTRTERFGDFDARLIDVELAQTVPLEPGQTISREFARPYVFAPLKDSVKISASAPLETTFTLAPGEYRYRFEIMDRSQTTDVDLKVEGAEIVKAPRAKIPEIVLAPVEAGLDVDAVEDTSVTITLGSKTREGATSRRKSDVRLHRWSIERTA